MTESEKQILRDKKAEVVRELSSFPLEPLRAEIGRCDRRAMRYVDECVAMPERHNLLELQEVLRVLRLISGKTAGNGGREPSGKAEGTVATESPGEAGGTVAETPGETGETVAGEPAAEPKGTVGTSGKTLGTVAEFRPSEVRKFVRMCEMMSPSGKVKGERLRLTAFECFVAMCLFGFFGADGYRQTRLVYIEVPRKFGKTLFAALVACFDLLCGEPLSEAYIAANSTQQAKICFKMIKRLLQSVPGLRNMFKYNRELCKFKSDRVSGSSVECLSANGKTKDGLSPTLAIIDEFAAARNTLSQNGADLKAVLQSGMGARKQPMTIVITTASEVLDGPYVEELKGVMKVLDGEIENDAMHAFIFQPDVDDAEDDENTWRKVQPHIGVTVSLDFYRQRWREAQLSAKLMLEFRTKQLDIFARDESATWFSLAKARDLCAPFDVAEIGKRSKCMCAFDLSIHDDFSAVSYGFFSYEDRRFYVYTDYYLPEDAAREHPNHALYDLWHEQGWLKYCKGAVIDFEMIAEDIMRMADRLEIVQIGYDKYKAQDLTNMLINITGRRDVLVPFSQTLGNFNLPVESMEVLAWSDPPRIVFHENPINAYCLSNCVIQEDHLENKKPFKTDSKHKIDGAITALMCIGMLYSYE